MISDRRQLDNILQLFIIISRAHSDIDRRTDGRTDVDVSSLNHGHSPPGNRSPRTEAPSDKPRTSVTHENGAFVRDSTCPIGTVVRGGFCPEGDCLGANVRTLSSLVRDSLLLFHDSQSTVDVKLLQHFRCISQSQQQQLVIVWQWHVVASASVTCLSIVCSLLRQR